MDRAERPYAEPAFHEVADRVAERAGPAVEEVLAPEVHGGAAAGRPTR